MDSINSLILTVLVKMASKWIFIFAITFFVVALAWANECPHHRFINKHVALQRRNNPNENNDDEAALHITKLMRYDFFIHFNFDYLKPKLI